MAVLADLLVRFGADSSGLRKELEGVQGELQKFPKAAESATKGAEKGFSSLGEAAKRYARDQRAEAKTAGFFVNQLADVIPISSEAKGSLTELGGAMVGGGALGIGLAVATVSVGLLAKAFYEQSKAAEEALAATKKWGDDLRQQLDQNLNAARLLNAEIREGALGRAQVQADIDRAAAANKLAEATKRKAEADKAFADAEESMQQTGLFFGYADTKKNAEEATKNYESALENVRAVTARTEAELTKTRIAAGKEQTRAVEEAYDKQTAAAKADYDKRLKMAQDAAKLGEPFASGADDNMLGGRTFTKLDESRPDMQRFNDLVAEQARVWEETRTPAEKYADELERLRTLYDETAIDQDTYNRAVAKATDAYAQSNQVAATMFSAVGHGFRELITGANSLAGAAEGVWNRMLDAFVSMVEQMVVKWLTAQAVMAAASVATAGAGAGPASWLGGVYGGGLGAEFFADGGDIRAGQLAIVGERGPEVFVPGASGKIIPNDQLGGGGSRTIVIAPQLADGYGFADWWARNEDHIVGRMNRLAYLGRTGG